MPALLALRALPWRLIGIVGLAFAILALYAHDRSVVAQNVKLKAELQSERDGRKEDRRRYTQAQADAAAKNKADVARIESEQERITHEVQSDLTARLERLRRELRSNAAPKGYPGQPGSPTDGKAAGGTDEEAGMCLTPEQLLRAAENEERHDQLITWIEQQLGVKR